MDEIKKQLVVLKLTKHYHWGCPKCDYKNIVLSYPNYNQDDLTCAGCKTEVRIWELTE